METEQTLPMNQTSRTTRLVSQVEFEEQQIYEPGYRVSVFRRFQAMVPTEFSLYSAPPGWSTPAGGTSPARRVAAHSRGVPDWLHGTYWLSSIERVLTAK